MDFPPRERSRFLFSASLLLGTFKLATRPSSIRHHIVVEIQASFKMSPRFPVNKRFTAAARQFFSFQFFDFRTCSRIRFRVQPVRLNDDFE